MKIGKFEITKEEFQLALFIAVLGYIFSLRSVILYYNSLAPLPGLVLYYVVLYGTLYLLSRLGLIVGRYTIKKPLQVLGAAVITFAFFAATNMGSQYVQYITKGDISAATNIFYQTEDGVLFAFWSSFIPISAGTIQTLAILTYVISPFIIALLGMALVEEKVRL